VTTVARRLAIVLVGLTTAACALTNTGDPNTAAVVGDERISTSEVQEQFDRRRNSAAFREQAQQNPSGDFDIQAQAQLVTDLVRSALLLRVAQRNDVQVSDADVDAVASDIVEQVGGREAFEQRLAEEGLSEEQFLEQVRIRELQAALQEQIGADADLAAFVRDETADLPIEINPRYGAWDATALAVTPTDPLAPAGEQASPAPGS
jgi:parvulin-like peptidyl-prolyl isomerase